MTHDLQSLGVSALPVEPPSGRAQQFKAGLCDLRSVRAQTPVHVIRRWLRLDQTPEPDPVSFSPDNSPATLLVWTVRAGIALFFFFLVGSVVTDIRGEAVREARTEARHRKNLARKIAAHVRQPVGPEVDQSRNAPR